ncbi:MAG: TatD family hydrolase [Phycisphaerales bacterium]|nr:TatD family hydrolase [Phycisphaerales bacterium]
MIDTHCHLTFPDFAGATHRTLDECEEMGVTGAITVSTTVADAHRALELALDDDRLWCSAGVHPLDSDKGPHDWDALTAVARHERCVAWGELGLDNHYKTPVRSMQDRILEQHLATIEGSGLDLPVILHCREAYGELISVLRRTSLPPERFVFHCFTAGPDDMRLLLDFGAWVSFTGVVTYKNADDVREAALLPPLDRIMIETDAPFLTPAPHRKIRPNHPKFSRVTAQFVADLHGVPWPEFHERINRNAERFFGLSDIT